MSARWLGRSYAGGGRDAIRGAGRWIPAAAAIWQGTGRARRRTGARGRMKPVRFSRHAR